VACQACGAGPDLLSAGIFLLSIERAFLPGRGQIVKERCPDCRGRGVWMRTYDRASHSAGVDTGTRYESGRGRARAHGGPAGDLYVVLEVRNTLL